MSIKQAKCFAAPNEKKFYDPMRVPEEQDHEKFNKLVNAFNAMHVRFSHASADELKRILKLNLSGFEEIKASILITGIMNVENFQKEK